MAKRNTNTEAQVEKTPEEIKAEKKARRDERNAAKKLVRNFMTENDLPEEVTDALNMLISFKIRKGRSGISKASKTQLIAEKLREQKSMSELELFQEFKVGRQAMKAQIRMFIKKMDPENRIWVTFDEETETYNLVAEGPNPPDGWEGYVPAEADEL